MRKIGIPYLSDENFDLTQEIVKYVYGSDDNTYFETIHEFKDLWNMQNEKIKYSYELIGDNHDKDINREWNLDNKTIPVRVYDCEINNSTTPETVYTQEDFAQNIKNTIDNLLQQIEC